MDGGATRARAAVSFCRLFPACLDGSSGSLATVRSFGAVS
jgi:hypothetical protein